MRIFAISDLHTDYDENRRWVSQLSRLDYAGDALIVAGDISDSEALVAECFQQLATRFRQVLYVPGNHELWIAGSKAGDSLEKFYRLLELAASCGVCTQRKIAGAFDIVPLFAWYDFSFGTPGSELLKSWMDFVHCRWPKDLANPGEITEFFLRQNEASLGPSDRTVISFSHFLPRIDLMPYYIPPKFRAIYPVLGSWSLDKQVRAVGSSVHIYGHSHVNRDVKIDGVRYINNAFAYPSEDRIAKKELTCIFDAV